jgi:hypothetical protein
MTRALARTWLLVLISPRAAFRIAASSRTADLGLRATLLRFIITAITEPLPLALIRRRPFRPPVVKLVGECHFYSVEVVFLPLFGLMSWLVMSATALAGVRRAGGSAQLHQVANIVGLGMLGPMAVLWPWDWAMIATNHFRVRFIAPGHALVEAWEAVLFAIGFSQAFGLRRGPALLLGSLLGAEYVGLAILFIR